MKLDIIAYGDLLNSTHIPIQKHIEHALLQKGIIGICDIPEFKNKIDDYIHVVRQFTQLDEMIKRQYSPNRDSGETEGYELGAEWFINDEGQWQLDDRKSSFYAFVPDHIHNNKWPKEVDLKTAYLALGELIFKIGKLLLNAININYSVGIKEEYLIGYGRMLHYHQENDSTNTNRDWCGGHFDHGLFTGLIPAHYFCEEQEVDEPEEAGLYIIPTNGDQYEKIEIPNKSVLLFQVGEFGQIISNDRIKATKHIVKKAKIGLDRYAFALFYSLINEFKVKSHSTLTKDDRYRLNKSEADEICYGKWNAASFEKYRAK